MIAPALGILLESSVDYRFLLRNRLSFGAVVGGGVTLKIYLLKCFLITEIFGSTFPTMFRVVKPNTYPSGSFGTRAFGVLDEPS